MIDWDDLRFILAVDRQGSAMAAAQSLGVNASTVQRRIARFEERHGVRLFERRQSGFKSTPECAALVEVAADIEDRVTAVSREILGRDFRLEGTLRVTSTDTFMNAEMAGHLAQFRTMHPRIKLELTLTNSRLDLSRQDADIAIRPSNNPPENLVGQRVARLVSGLFADADTVARLGANPSFQTIKSQPWIGLGEELENSPLGQWMGKALDPAKMALQVDTFPAVCALIEAGIGIGMLPCTLGDANDALHRIGPPVEDTAIDIWVLTHPEIRSAAKVRAFMDFITAAMRAQQARLDGSALHGSELRGSAKTPTPTQPTPREK
ncbi:MAG: LysR family transcriptional regulator [Pseudomonadota bacterium]